MTLVDELNELKDTEIAVVMNDGQAYRGKLEAHDKDTIIMVNILETSNVDVDWVETKGKKKEGHTIKGYMHWRRITLPKLIIRTHLVLRVWPWQPKKV
jgi:small nuclear ribonucleoprotein (snRNP)-like protein